MSRCFPYPQHGYFAKIAGNEALIDSVKLQRETEKAVKAVRKKERELEKTIRSDQLGKRKRVGGDDDEQKKCDSGNLERSNVTEELGKPSSYGQNPCASDSSEDSNRRKRPATVETETGIRANGRVLKIRLSPPKLKDPVELSGQLTCVNTIPAAPSTSGTSSGRRRTHGFTSLDKKMKLVSLLYKDLVSDFAPLHESSSWAEADNSWLFETRIEERCKPKRDVMIVGNSSLNLWPKARYLSEVELYALPFTVPF